VSFLGLLSLILSNDDRPLEFEYIQSTSQGYYFIPEIFINGNPIESDDWVGAFNGDICVGSRKWDTSQCGGGVCDVPVMGEDGTENTSGYMNVGDIPSFKVFDSSEDEFVDMNFYNHYPNSEDVSWYNLATIQLDQLINDDYYFVNASDFENTATITSIFTDDIYEMGLGDILVGYLDDEIRSIAISTNNDVSSGYVFFSSIFLNQKINNCTFKYYNYENNLIFNIGQSFTFNIDDSFGNAQYPIVLNTQNNQLGI